MMVRSTLAAFSLPTASGILEPPAIIIQRDLERDNGILLLTLRGLPTKSSREFLSRRQDASSLPVYDQIRRAFGIVPNGILLATCRDTQGFVYAAMFSPMVERIVTAGHDPYCAIGTAPMAVAWRHFPPRKGTPDKQENAVCESDISPQ